MPRDSLHFVFADTGNEHEITLDYIANTLAPGLGIKIETVRADFTGDFDRKRTFIREKWPAKGVPLETVERAAALLQPSGIPFLDICMLKGRFPSRMAQFCTQELKIAPIVEHQMALIDSGTASAVWSWQGVRLDESPSRKNRLQGTGACVRSFDDLGGGIFNYRPILRWTADDAFEAHRCAGISANPLYKQGQGRVGCMPCINCGKDEVLQIFRRWPEHIERIAEWERIVGGVSRRGEASFFPDPIAEAHLMRRGIYKVVEWSKTSRGGLQFDMFRTSNEPPKVCESEYGLCE